MSIDLRHIKGYTFQELTIALAVALYTQTNMGYRNVAKVLGIVFEAFRIDLRVPSHQTISDWVARDGLSTYANAGKEFEDAEYATIVDESISIGSQKLLVVEAVPAEHPGRPLRQSDIAVLGMEVAPSWDLPSIQAACASAEAKAGHSPEYRLSDWGRNLCGALDAATIPHHHDISHTMGDILKDAYAEDPAFKKFTSLLGKKRLQYHLTEKAYLLPPNMRTVCRFMNISAWVGWAKLMLDRLDSLDPDMAKAYKFLLKHKALVEELHPIVACIREAEAIIKNHGLSKATADRCINLVSEKLVTPERATPKMRAIGAGIMQYLIDEAFIMPEGLKRINLSSDIIESTFGLYKGKKSPDKLVGVRRSVLAIPLYGKLSTPEGREEFDTVGIMESVRMEDVKEWLGNNLLDNWTIQRRIALRG